MRALHISPFTSTTPSLHGPISGVSAGLDVAISCCWGLCCMPVVDPVTTGLTHLNHACSLLYFQLGPPHQVKSSQVTFIYIALLTIQIVTKQLHNIKMGK